MKKSIPTYLKKHSMFSQEDYDYFVGKGYTNKEIKAFWDRDANLGNPPLKHGKIFDIVGYING